MDQLRSLSDFFNAIAGDPRISITHIGIYAALLQYRDQMPDNPIFILSHEIMRLVV